MNEKVIKQEIQKLIDKFEKINKDGKYKKYNEEQTKKNYILPLFRALGWDVESDDVKAEEKVSKKRVDYAFKINGVSKFYLECKPFREDISEPKYAKQAIEYAWNKSVTWAILCNFKGIKVFNAEWKWDDKQPTRNRFLDLRYNEYNGSCFKYLIWLSRDNFERGILDEQATILGKKVKKLPISKQLLADFTEYRNLLSKDILRNNNKTNISKEELDEIVQRILDRIIFIRTCEDKIIESEKLESLIRIHGKKEGKLYKELNKKFRDYDEGYNSKLFRKHLCENVIVSNDVLKHVIFGTYRSKKLDIRYDFSAINADVLGNIYEQYLGHILKSTSKRAKLTNGKTHRKEQGIYYTPTYIVDYIVRNTLGEQLKKRGTKVDEIKILDPACGSGSFLIKAFDILIEYVLKKESKSTTLQSRFEDIHSGSGGTLKRKTELLKNCIFGVDLDPQAVEITQLNLLLKLAEKRYRLPTLKENIKCGNSLIDNPEITGEKAFIYNEEFEDIFQNGGFDVVVGNPPYIPIELFADNEKEYYFSNYSSPYRKFDSAILFIEKGISLLKNKGLIGFIVPLTWQTGENYQKFRELIFSKCDLKCVINLPFDVFQDAYVDTGIFILQKGKIKNNKFIAFSFDKKAKIKKIEDVDFQEIEQKYIDNHPEKKVFTNKFVYSILEKINKNAVPLGDITDSCQGVVVSKYPLAESKINDSYKKLLLKGIGNRYYFELDEVGYIDYSEVMHLYKYYSQPRLFIRRIINRQNRIMSFYYDQPLITKKDYNPFISISNEFDIKYLLGLINSKLFSYVYIYSSTLALKDDFRQTTLSEIRKLPIKKVSKMEQNEIIKLVDKVTSLNNRLVALKDKKTDESNNIEEQIKKTDAKIDELVYKLYGLTKEEIKTIENGLI